ncbi:MAG TPA: cytochrome c oxidase assembly protein [Acidimicrobiales bacterium]|nr:cytochrome c oxidase assembly protein [Acidimicrobiales bacterium]
MSTPGPWVFHPHAGAWLALGAMVVLYVLGVRRAARAAGAAGRPTRRQCCAFAAGMAFVALAGTWPLADLAAHWSLTALVVQRLVLTLAAAPLLLASLPSALAAGLTRPAAVDVALDAITRPVVAVVVFSLVALGTLLPPAVAAQASSAGWRALTDGALLVAGAVLWGPAMHNIPGVHRNAPLGVAVYLFVQSIVPTFLAVIYVFAHRPFYGAFAGVHDALGMSRLVDQQTAGVVAKVGTLPVLWTAAWRALARAQRAEETGEDGEPLTWAEVERHLERAERAERARLAGRRGLLGRHRAAGVVTTAPGGGAPTPAGPEETEPHSATEDGGSGVP